METRTVEQVNQWESRPFSGGLAGLRELADAEFSGAVEVDGTWAFVLNGRVIGVFEGQLDDFEGRDGTAYRTPDQALPLLFTMQELGGQTQAKYYTNDTPLSEAHETLSEASFSGYVELSENVLSGDYYVVYYGGRSMSTAFVGESERLITGEEAFERADDEVGIYEVRKVDLDVIDLSEVVEEPEPEPEDESIPGPPSDPQPEPASDPQPEPDPRPESDSRQESDTPPEPATEAEEEKSGPTPDRSPDADEVEANSGTHPQEQESDASDPAGPGERARAEPTSAAEADSSTSGTDSSASPADATEAGTGQSGSTGPQGAERTEDVFNEEEQWRQAKAIPSLDPGRSASRTGQRAKARQRSRSDSTGTTATSSDAKPKSPEETDSEDGANVDEFKQALQQSNQEIERLSERLSQTESEQQELIAQREELRSEVKRLRSQLENAKASNGGTETTTGRSLAADRALEGTNLFVRYGSKSDPTLADAREGADREAVNANLSLEHHTQFDADEVVVDGQEFEAFLEESIQYRFVRWLIEDLLYEIRDTGQTGALRELFDGLPRIDRAELSGTATIRKTEDGEEIRTQRTFDVILRDRMGNPLVVANINDARDPATGDMMADLVAAATDVGETNPSLSAAVFVTASFFEPAALETAADATGGGLLSREKKESYVKLSRKRGYHLCLVETRGGQFHVNVPEL